MSFDLRLVVLGAGRSVTGAMPSAVVSVGENRVLDWQMAAFSGRGEVEILFVGGFRAHEVESRYPEIRYFFNPDWSETGPLASLSLVPLEAGIPTYVAYSDIVFRPRLIERFESVDADLALAVDSSWRNRYESRSRADLDSAEKARIEDGVLVDAGRHVPTEDASAEIAGVMRVSGQATSAVREILDAGDLPPRAGLPGLLRLLMERDVRPHLVDVRGDWAELNAPQDLARFVLGTKAESLDRLRSLVRVGHIGPLTIFSQERWHRDPEGVISEVSDKFGARHVIVRSSALTEDGWSESAAGAYASVPDIPADDEGKLREAIHEVFASYGEPSPEDQVLVQEMLREVAMSGVVMTRTPSLGAPYLVINFDDSTSRTDTVTAGDSESIRTVYLHRDAQLPSSFPGDLGKVLEAVREVEELVGHDSLDIEFAVDRDGLCHVLQARPIAISRHQPMDDGQIADRLRSAHEFLGRLQHPGPFLFGSRTQLSVMTDWNPAEMIGTKPGRLAFSLYRYLITDEVWARQRAEYGYRDVRPCNLIVDVLGQPYVDVRADFNSFVPAALDDDLAESLVEHYLDHLERSPELHDKVEFDILFSCLSLDFDRRSRTLLEAGFNTIEVKALRDALRELTRDGIGRCATDVSALDEFRERYEAIVRCGLPPLERAFLLLEDVRRIGLPLFAHLARAGFVAVTILRSLEEEEILDTEQKESFLSELRTIPTLMREDAAKVRTKELSWNEFVDIYGHLRPGSYDITSPNYRSAPEEFLGPILEQASRREESTDESGSATDPWDAETRDAIAGWLAEEELCSYDELVAFLESAIVGRELGKFTFMRNVDAALEALAEFGSDLGVEREDLACISISELWSLRGAPTEDRRDAVVRLARLGREQSFVTQAVCLPAQIFAPDDIYAFEQLGAEPNFVTGLRVDADVVVLGGGASATNTEIDGKLVLIPNADPGFDWLFTRDIAGLVTTYGGVNSHMAIRAAELRLPAAIGIGELLFEKLSAARRVELDCGARKIHVVA